MTGARIASTLLLNSAGRFDGPIGALRNSNFPIGDRKASLWVEFGSIRSCRYALRKSYIELYFADAAASRMSLTLEIAVVMGTVILFSGR